MQNKEQMVREQFPILERTVHGKSLVYLDSAASTQRPRRVLEAMHDFYTMHNANIHRGVHVLSQEATKLYEDAREQVREFLHAGSSKEIIFVRGATEAINLVASSYGQRIQAGDEIVVSYLEHHSNIVPWQLLCERTGAVLKVLPITDIGELDTSAWETIITERTKVVAVTHISNAIGTVTPLHELITKAHACGAVVLVDGAQAVGRIAVDVQELNADFYVFSGHKLYGPTGIGVLYGKEELLSTMPPYQGGGDMIAEVSFERTTYAPLPAKFEAGTPHIAGAIGLGAACRWVQELGFDWIWEHEQELLKYLEQRLQEFDDLRIVGTSSQKAGACSFFIPDIHPHDIGTIMDMHGVALRTGQHCAEPLMKRLGIPATARISLGVYTTREEIDSAIDALAQVIHLFRS